MRVNERTIREVLRSEAARVVPPPNLWERIERELDRDRVRRERRVSRRSLFGFQRLAAAAFVAVCLWFLITPALPGMPQAALFPGRWADIERTWVAAVWPLSQPEEGRPAVTDLRWSSREITLLR